MIKKLNRICVNCGSSPGLHPEYMEMAEKPGRTLAGMGIDPRYTRLM